MEIKGSRKRKLEEKGKETISLAINTVDIRTDMKEAKNIDEEDEEEFEFMKNLPMQDLRSILDERGISYKNVLEKNELLEMIKSQLTKEKKEGIVFRRKKSGPRRDCPYLDTIRRNLLDFDFEKVCSVTLQNLNVYACLVCGKYFQGRGRNSQAYLHSLQANHHVFINLQNEHVYCLPDDYEVIDPSLSDIKYTLNPTFLPEQIEKIEQNTKMSPALDGSEYLAGFVGLNNIKSTDYINVVVQLLIRVPPFRNFFMIERNYSDLTQDPLVYRFGELIRKMFNPKNFKAHVDPHEFVQAVSTASEKKFYIGVSSDPIEFIQFLLNHLHRALGGTKKKGSSVVYKVFQGEVEMSTKTKDNESPTVKATPFLYLTLEVPPAPLFKDEQEKNIIPQVPIFDLLKKFDGNTVTHIATTGEMRTFRISTLPPYLVLHVKRFTKNNWFTEKNPTIVTSPLKNLDMKDYLTANNREQGSTKYDLIANICHEGEPRKGTYRVYVLHKAGDQWYEIQDLMVKKILPQLIPVSEAYVQVYERQR